MHHPLPAGLFRDLNVVAFMVQCLALRLKRTTMTSTFSTAGGKRYGEEGAEAGGGGGSPSGSGLAAGLGGEALHHARAEAVVELGAGPPVLCRSSRPDPGVAWPGVRKSAVMQS